MSSVGTRVIFIEARQLLPHTHTTHYKTEEEEEEVVSASACGGGGGAWTVWYLIMDHVDSVVSVESQVWRS